MKVLLTGFDAFAGEKINPASLILDKLGENIGGIDLYKLTIPTVFEKSANIIEEAIKKINPDIIISLGQAGGRTDIYIERVAINIDDATISDNEGNTPVDKKIRKDGENAYFSTLPIKAIVKALRDKDIPASVSNTAGTYVCNHVFYQDLYLAKKFGGIKAGFIHVPYLPSQVIGKSNTPSMSLSMMVEAVGEIIKTSALYYEKPDISLAEGKIS